MTTEIEKLASALEEASAAYHAGTPLMSDAAYDLLESRLRSMDPNHPTLKKVGAPTDKGWPKVRHPIPMGSLGKVQNHAEFTSWVQARASSNQLFVSEKLDGASVLLTYENCVLVRAATRGDGLEGEDITRNVRVMKGVPKSIPTLGTVYIRGEIVCLKSDFAAHFQGESNPRNTAAGTAKRQTGWQKCKHLTVMVYNLTIVGKHIPSRLKEFADLRSWGFELPNWHLFPSLAEVINLRNLYIQTKRASLDYIIDGLVVEINDTAAREAQGDHDMRPKGATAFKFDHESQPTILRNIIWSVGNSGRVTPIGVFDPVNLAGANVKQASLYNVSYIGTIANPHGRSFLRVGDEVLVSRRNDVIPRIEEVVQTCSSGADLSPPTTCPACNGPLTTEGEYLLCKDENETCSAQVLGSLRRWIGKIGVLHFGDALLSACIDAGLVSTIGDLYRLQTSQVENLLLDGRRAGGSGVRALDELNQHKNLTLDLFVGSLGIPLVGRKMVQVLMEAGVTDLNKMSKVTVAQMASIPGFGQGRAEAFRKGFDERKGLIVDILAAGVSIVEPRKVEQKSSTMAGKSVCVTGFRDAALDEAVAAAGGTMKSGVAKGLTYLVCKDVSSSSGKAQKAQALGVQVVDVPTIWAIIRGEK